MISTVLSTLLVAGLASAVPATPPSLAIGDIIHAQSKHHLENLAGQRYASLKNTSAYDDVAQPGPGPVNAKMLGTFVSNCEQFFAFENGDINKPVACSSVAAERIDSQNMVITDLTIYVNDFLCRPNASYILAKIVLKSKIEYGPMSNVPQNRGGKLVTYTPVEGNYTFNYQGPYGEIIQELNYFCPCNGTTDPKDKKMWQSDVTRTITPSDCARGPSKSPGDSDLCNLVTGYPMYQTYKWIDYGHYIQSEGAFDKIEGWGLPLNRSIVNTKLDESGAKNPDDCTYVEWPECKAGVTRSAEICSTCATPLECESCIFYEFPADIASKSYEWNYCCPCIYNYADKHDNSDWMKVNC